jgi:hypothetical protein
MLPMMAPVKASKYMPQAKSAALSALNIDENLIEARASLAFVKWHYDWNWLGAEREFKRCSKLAPIGPSRTICLSAFRVVRAIAGRTRQTP